jgi:hypothetical protein
MNSHKGLKHIILFKKPTIALNQFSDKLQIIFDGSNKFGETQTWKYYMGIPLKFNVN